MVATILSLVCSYALVGISLWSIWTIEGTINPDDIFCKQMVNKMIEMEQQRGSKVHRCDSLDDKKDLIAYLGAKVENYDKFASFLV